MTSEQERDWKGVGQMKITKTDQPTYNVFVRNWWKENPSWPNGLEPDGGSRKRYLARSIGYAEAREMCEQYAKDHNPGMLSRKAEFEQA